MGKNSGFLAWLRSDRRALLLVAAAVVGILAFGEPLSLSVVFGLGCILVSVYILR